MKTTGRNWVALTAVVFALTAPAQQTQAQGLFDSLFGGKPKRVTQFPAAPNAPTETQKRKLNRGKSAAAPRIEAPSYNEYRADPLVRVDFTKLAEQPQTAAMQSGARLSVADLAAALSDYKLVAEKPIAAALLSHYGPEPAPIWITNGQPNDKAKAALRIFSEASSEGMEPSDYAVELPGLAEVDPEAALARFEVTLSARLLRYVRDAQAGRIDPNRISGYYDFPAKTLDYAGILTGLAAEPDVSAFLARQHPQNEQYRALRAELAALRASDEQTISVDPKLLLKPGETSAELPKLLSLVARDLDDELGGEFGEIIQIHGTSEAYSEELVPLFRTLQKRAGLKPDGVIGPRTVQSLTGVSVADRIVKVEVALEQLRWLPSELGATRVFINQPSYTATYFEGGAEKLNMRTVIGKTSNQTSFFYDEIEQVDYNPYWGVPQSILVNEMLPRLRRDPGYLDRAGYEVFNAKGKKVPSSSVSWGAYGANIPFNIRQVPSEANALGELKILFPNKHAIYMHDTPEKSFFQRDMRALSHGCIRLSDPRGMASAVLGKPREYIEAKLAKGHSMEKVERKIPVYVAYFTAWPNAAGTVEYFNDVYGRDARLQAAIDKTDAVRAPTS